MSPQPLSSVVKDVGWEFNHDSLAKRPQLSAYVTRVISTWAFTDSLIGRFVSRLLKADFEVVASMLNALASSDARRRAVTAAARTVLDDDDFDLFTAVMRATKPSRDRRNDFAHHLWGLTPALPDALLLLNPKDYYVSEARFEQALAGGQPSQLPSPVPEPAQIFVYREAELHREAKAAAEAYGWFHLALNFALNPGHVAAPTAREDLLNRPQIRLALSKSDKSE